MKRGVECTLLLIITLIVGCASIEISGQNATDWAGEATATMAPSESLEEKESSDEPVLEDLIRSKIYYESGPRSRHALDAVASPAPSPPVAVTVPSADSKSDQAGDVVRYWTVRTYFATNRNLAGRNESRSDFGNMPGEISYGICDVTIPKSHRIGETEMPSVWRLQFAEDPDKHMTVKSVEVLDRDDFFGNLSSRIQQASHRSALIFVHGYNVTFENAARRTAQIAFDLNFQGAAVFFSWPSAGTVMAYPRDAQVSEITRPKLKEFLVNFLIRSDVDNVFVIAHSMGARVVAPVIAELLQLNNLARERIKEVILAAPDIDATVFTDQIAPAFIAAGEPVTLYASSNDYALLASKIFNGFPRLGDSGKGMVIIAGMETIDASDVPTDFLGHSYIGNSRSLVSDIYYIIAERLRADRRAGLSRVDRVAEGTPYWVFKK